jgi:hypothetical protein
MIHEIHTYFHEWVEALGTEDPLEGTAAAKQWLDGCGWDEQEFNKMLNCVSEHATQTVMIEAMEGDPTAILRLGFTIAFVAFRFGLDVESHKRLPSL